MRKFFRSNTGVAAMEYMGVVIILLVVMVSTGYYLRRGIQGRWKSTGEAFSHGRLHGRGTLDCFRDPRTNNWAGTDCYDNNCRGVCNIMPGVNTPSDLTYGRCIQCINNCPCADGGGGPAPPPPPTGVLRHGSTVTDVSPACANPPYPCGGAFPRCADFTCTQATDGQTCYTVTAVGAQFNIDYWNCLAP